MKRKVYKIAQELNLATDTILAFLEKDHKVDISKKINTQVEEDAYISVLKHFNQSAYHDYFKNQEDDRLKEKSVGERKIDMKSRSLELDEILKGTNEEHHHHHEDKVKHDNEADNGDKARHSRRIKHSDEDARPVVNKIVEAEVVTPVAVPVVPVAVADKSQLPPAAASATAEKTPHADKTSDKPRFDHHKKEYHGKTEHRDDHKHPARTDAKPADNRHGAKNPPIPVVDIADLSDKNGKKAKPKSDPVKDKAFADKNKAAGAKISDDLKRKKHKQAYGVIDPEAPVLSQKHKKKKARPVDQEQVKDSVKNTLNTMTTVTAKSFKKKKKFKKTEETGELVEVEVNVITATEFISTSELASKLEVSVTDIITKCFKMGLMITINQRLDKESIELIASEYGFEVEFESQYEEDLELIENQEEELEELEERPPVVTIMGHVDHGKTSLLDYIRKAKVVSGEAGGITQHIGAYEVTCNNGKHITFLDTPGHEAFTAMRARGAKVTDIVVIVVAADDRVMPQTIEAIDHSRAAGVPIIIAINKVDKHTADPEKIKIELSQQNILVESFGGKIQCVNISAKTGIGVDSLLEAILIEAEMLELKANAKVRAKAAVVESRLDKGLGSIATVLVQKGTLSIGDIFVCGQFSGRVRALFNERMERVQSAGPAIPVVVLGFSGTPSAGDTLVVTETEQEAKEIASKRQQLQRVHSYHKTQILTLDQVSERIKLGQIKDLNIILKGDVDGSIEAISDSIMKLSNDEVAVKIIHRGVGTITESDILLAKASDAIILGFNVRPNLKARELSSREHVEIRQYSIIYKLIEEVKQALEGMLAPEISEDVVATIEVRATFKVPKIGTIAGCYVLSGKINRNSKIRLIRNDVQVFQGRISSLKRHKDDVREVLSGFECGIGIENYNDVHDGDIIEVYEIKETLRTLD